MFEAVLRFSIAGVWKRERVNVTTSLRPGLTDWPETSPGLVSTQEADQKGPQLVEVVPPRSRIRFFSTSISDLRLSFRRRRLRCEPPHSTPHDGVCARR